MRACMMNWHCSHLLAAKDQALLYWWDALLLFDALLYLRNLVVRLNIEFDLFPCEGTDSARGLVSFISRRWRGGGVSGALDEHCGGLRW